MVTMDAVSQTSRKPLQQTSVNSTSGSPAESKGFWTLCNDWPHTLMISC